MRIGIWGKIAAILTHRPEQRAYTLGPALVAICEAAIEAWMARHAPPDEKLTQEWRHTLVLTRKRGFRVILRARIASKLREVSIDSWSGRTIRRCMLSWPSCEKANVISDWSAQ